MTKQICFPFIGGNLQGYSDTKLTEEETKLVYQGKPVIKGHEVWKPNSEVELTLSYEGYGRGKSSVVFYWLDEDGHEYPMFIKDVDEMMKENTGSKVHAIFTYVKRGANYGIRYLRRVADA